jgi:Cu2+-exporting ATPase
MDVPIALALGLSFAAGTINLITGVGESFFDSITMFVAFILAARYVELLARQAAQGGAEALAKQLPATCERACDYPGSHKIEIVPVVVIGPPVSPVPVSIDVIPEPEANEVQAPLYPSNKPVVEL